MKTLKLILALALMSVLLVSCGEQEEEVVVDDTNVEAPAPEAPAPEAPAPEDTIVEEDPIADESDDEMDVEVDESIPPHLRDQK